MAEDSPRSCPEFHPVWPSRPAGEKTRCHSVRQSGSGCWDRRGGWLHLSALTQTGAGSGEKIWVALGLCPHSEDLPAPCLLLAYSAPLVLLSSGSPSVGSWLSVETPSTKAAPSEWILRLILKAKASWGSLMLKFNRTFPRLLQC